MIHAVKRDVNRIVLWAIILVSAYIACQMIADVAAVKLVSIAGMVVPAGTFVYAATFTLRDALHKRLGKRAAQATIVAATGVNIVMALYFMFTIALPTPPFWQDQDAYSTVLGVVPYIVIASIVAELVSELVDTELYSIARNSFAKSSGRTWMRVVFSNAVSVPVDSVVFAFLAFSIFPNLFGGGHPMTFVELTAMVIGQSALKWIIAAVATPLTYLTGPDVA